MRMTRQEIEKRIRVFLEKQQNVQIKQKGKTHEFHGKIGIKRASLRRWT